MDAPTIRPPEKDELPALAELRWRWVLEQGGTPAVERERFVRDFVDWASRNESTHRPVIMLHGGKPTGMAWLALLPRVPTPYAVERYSGDVQCVYVVPEERSRGYGGSLIEALLRIAHEIGVDRVTVHSSDRAIPAYRRYGFEYSPRLLQTGMPVVREETGSVDVGGL
ncbi:GNAT family N-acetyltransferase [Nocardiopsis alba]|uniref:GNAT family N-acetyltransferase n=1 Tax=Nocardiopsis alba TaxID=53437 RepID=UPI0005A70817|nr:GNAT family N-acetyltransferase [Nocardiopsis alba]